MPRTKYSALEKLALLKEFGEANISVNSFARSHNIGRSAFLSWQELYARDGISGLEEAKRNRHYSDKLKQEAVLAYLNHEDGLQNLAIRFGLRSNSQLRSWVMKYNEDKTLAASPSRKQVPTVTRKTTFDERIEIVEYVTKDKHSYAEAAEHYQVSYQQARSWVLKAKDGGYEALIDNRGHRKENVELTEMDKLKLENRRLKAELADKDLMEEFTKKLLEIQRRG